MRKTSFFLLNCDINININLRSDFIHLYRQFKEFSETNIIGVALNQTPHYFDKSRKYRERNPETQAGSPGPLQVRI